MSTSNPAELPFDPSTTPRELASSLTDIESALSPFLSKEWAGQLEGLTPLERAKMDVMMAYTIVDLIWVYLKMKGVDPAKHPVMPELQRVRGYYTKIRSLEKPEVEARKTKIDVPAASRFILSGIPTSRRLGDANGSTQVQSQKLPQTSAAGAAQAGRERAAREQEEAASLERMGMSGRMRFVAEEAERVVIPSRKGEDGIGGRNGIDNEEEVEILEVVDVEDDHHGGDGDSDDFEMLDGPPGTRTPAEQTEDLLAEVETSLASAKRKRAEEA